VRAWGAVTIASWTSSSSRTSHPPSARARAALPANHPGAVHATKVRGRARAAGAARRTGCCMVLRGCAVNLPRSHATSAGSVTP
jgi:hypothetical protein